jgi:hypothetical protein
MNTGINSKTSNDVHQARNQSDLQHSATGTMFDARKDALTSPDIPDFMNFLKLTTTDFSEFQNKWSILIFAINVYNFFTVFYFLGIEGFPSEAWLHIEIFSEIILIIDIALRVVMARTEIWKRFWMLHESTPMLVLLLSSMPLTIAFKSSEDEVNITLHWVAYIKLVKLLRYP